jgi:RNA polymerase sigma-70 factor (ECF subfamily)
MDEGSSCARAAPLEPSRWVDEHGDCLYAFALARVGRPDVAEDLVQETLLAALKSLESFEGRSSERTWLVGILKYKLLDRLRRDLRQAPAALDRADEWLDNLYDGTGHLQQPPGEWGSDPAELLQRREFWDAFEECRSHLPVRLREVLSLRLLDEVPAAEICRTLEITPNNLWTLLHRARLRLWQCLDRRGLSPFPQSGRE